MDKKPYIILTASPKGGVGKTIVSINLGTALREAGYDVLLVDTDVANPSINLLLGATTTGSGYAEVIHKEADIKDVLVLYPSSGFYYIPAGGDNEELKADPDEISKFYSDLMKSSFDFIIIDTPPGYDIDPASKMISEALIVTTPEETAVRGAQKLSASFSKRHILHKLVINRVKIAKYQLAEETIEKLYGDVAYAMVPEEKTIDESEAKHTPAYLLNRTSLFSMSMDELSRPYLLKIGATEEDIKARKNHNYGIKKFFGLK